VVFVLAFCLGVFEFVCLLYLTFAVCCVLCLFVFGFSILFMFNFGCSSVVVCGIVGCVCVSFACLFVYFA